MPSKSEMYTSYHVASLRQWVVDVEPSEAAPNLIYLRGHCPANGTRYGFMTHERQEIPSRVQAIRGLKGIQRIEDGFYTSIVYCEPERQAALVEEMRGRLAQNGFLTTAEWEGRAAEAAVDADPRPKSHLRKKYT